MILKFFKKNLYLSLLLVFFLALVLVNFFLFFKVKKTDDSSKTAKKGTVDRSKEMHDLGSSYRFFIDQQATISSQVVEENCLQVAYRDPYDAAKEQENLDSGYTKFKYHGAIWEVREIKEGSCEYVELDLALVELLENGQRQGRKITLTFPKYLKNEKNDRIATIFSNFIKRGVDLYIVYDHNQAGEILKMISWEAPRLYVN
ncbi:hypothetical protein ACFLZ1_04240 [Patescibacteria group bacterium]